MSWELIVVYDSLPLLLLFIRVALFFELLSLTEGLINIFEFISISSWSEVFHRLIQEIVDKGETFLAQRQIILLLPSAALLLELKSEKVLVNKPLKRENGNYLSCLFVDVERVDPKIQPRKRPKVNCLADVESSWESAVVASWKGYNKLAWALDQPIDIDPIFLEKGGWHHSGHVVDEVRLVLLQTL